MRRWLLFTLPPLLILAFVLLRPKALSERLIQLEAQVRQQRYTAEAAIAGLPAESDGI